MWRVELEILSPSPLPPLPPLLPLLLHLPISPSPSLTPSPPWDTDLTSSLPDRSSDFGRWQATLIRQIVDLREMEENGTLADRDRYFGVNSPRQSRWYNFEPPSYLE